MKPRSDHFNGKIFLNPVPTEVMEKGAFFRVMKKYMQKHPGREPKKPLGPFTADLQTLEHLPPDALRVTWLGHSGTILEIDGKRLLTDPLWYQRVSPFAAVGPKRFFQNPIDLYQLPRIDLILLSHDHYDHLDGDAILWLVKEKRIPVITMLGVGKRLTGWGAPPDLVTELDWWESADPFDGFRITAAPARHFSGRWVNDRFSTLWGSFAIRGPKHNVYFGADSGYYDGFKAIGERLGPFDLTMLEIGAYDPEWAAIHMGPDLAIQAQQDLGSGLLMPIHWGTFNLALHPWKEPVEWVLTAAAAKGVELLLPRPGETYEVSKGAYNSKWWEGYE